MLREPLCGEAIRLILRNCRQFEVGSVYRRKDIGAVIVKELARHGAEKPADKNPTLAFKAVFSRATKSSSEALQIPFKRVESSDQPQGAWGWYEFTDGSDTAVAVAALEPTRIYGDGKCCVYAWFLPLYARQGKDTELFALTSRVKRGGDAPYLSRVSFRVTVPSVVTSL